MSLLFSNKDNIIHANYMYFSAWLHKIAQYDFSSRNFVGITIEKSIISSESYDYFDEISFWEIGSLLRHVTSTTPPITVAMHSNLGSGSQPIPHHAVKSVTKIGCK